MYVIFYIEVWFLTFLGLVPLLLSSCLLRGEVPPLHLVHHALGIFQHLSQAFIGHHITAGACLVQLVKQSFKDTKMLSHTNV